MRRKHQYPSLLCSDTRTHRGAVSEGQRLPKPYYKTELGVAYLGDSLDFLPLIETESINLIVTSPPFALKRKKEYGNVDAHEYVDWFLPFAKEFWRILRSDGSFVLDIGGSWSPGLPTKTLYNFELLIRLCRDVGFHLAEDFYWLNPAKLPSPAEWVNVRRIRVKDAIDPVWWLSKTPFPKAVWSRHLDEVQQQSRRSNSVELTDDRKHGVQQLLFARLPRGGAKAAPSEVSAGASRILRQVSDEQERRRT